MSKCQEHPKRGQPHEEMSELPASEELVNDEASQGGAGSGAGGGGKERRSSWRDFRHRRNLSCDLDDLVIRNCAIKSGSGYCHLCSWLLTVEDSQCKNELNKWIPW